MTNKPSVHCLPILDDNYIWIMQSLNNHRVIIFDPGHAAPIKSFLHTHELEVEAIFITHSHHDHINGIVELLKEYPAPVYGPRCDRIPKISHYLSGGDTLTLPGFGEFEVIHVPGHLPEHLAYLVQEEHSLKLIGLFSGDILFSSGCGRIFDGTAKELHQSLNRLACLPNDLLVYGSHEYTLANIEFALSIEPNNADILKKQEHCASLRSLSQPTLPTTIGAEKATNPFLRCAEETVRKCILGHKKYGKKLKDIEGVKDYEIFAELRKMKDVF